MLTDEELTSLVRLGYEPRGIERKRGASLSDGEFVENVARAAMALANQRDGGYVLIGVENDDVTGADSGLSDDLIAEWLDYDQVTDKLNRWADPPVRIDLARRALPGGGLVVVMQVEEFEQIPVICKRDGRRLQQGRIYTRSMAKTESSSAITQNELREVLNLAAEKQTRRFVETAERAGLQVRADVDLTAGFRPQVMAWEQAATRVLTVPHWRLEVRPLTFEEHRVDYAQLAAVVQQIAVRMRGWPLPFIERPGYGDDWVGEEYAGSFSEGESWRLYESGLFLHAQGISTQYEADWRSPSGEQQAAGHFPAWLPVAFLTEAFTLAGRLQRLLDAATPLQVTVAAESLQGWQLVAGNPGRVGFHSAYVFNSEHWRRSIELTPETALTGVRALAVDWSRNLLHRFGWLDASEEMVRGIQEEIFGIQQ